MHAPIPPALAHLARLCASLPFAAVAIAALGVWIATLAALQYLRTEALVDAGAARANLARLTAARQEASFRAIDSSLRQLRDVWMSDPASFPAAVRRREAELRSEGATQVALFDAEGNLLYGLAPTPAGIRVGDRAYFAAQRDARSDELVLSEPLAERTTGARSIVLSRRLAKADGSFAGVVIVTVPPPALERFLKEIDLGRDSVITLARSDGTILARSSGFERTAGVSLKESAALDPARPAFGSFAGRARVDAFDRLFTYKRLEGFPVVALIGQRESVVLEAFGHARNIALTLTAAATLLLLALGLLWAEVQRRSRAAAEARERLILELHDGSIQSLYAVGLALEGSRRHLREHPDRADGEIAQAQAALSVVMHDLRSFIAGAAETGATGDELVRSVLAMLPAPQPGVPQFAVQFEEAAARAISPEQSAQVLRIARESVSNIVRHSKARRASLTLRVTEEGLCFEAVDDGVGTSAIADSPGLGLRHIQARASRLGGRARVDSEGGGTRVTVHFPRAA